MRFKAQVTVNNRMLSNQGGNCVKVKGKPPVSSLAIGRKPKHLIKDDDNIKDPEVFVLHCTAQNRSGFKYAVKQNIEKVSFPSIIWQIFVTFHLGYDKFQKVKQSYRELTYHQRRVKHISLPELVL